MTFQNKTYFCASVWLEALQTKQAKQVAFAKDMSPVVVTQEQTVAIQAYEVPVQPEVVGETEEIRQIRAIHFELAQLPALAL